MDPVTHGHLKIAIEEITSKHDPPHITITSGGQDHRVQTELLALHSGFWRSRFNKGLTIRRVTLAKADPRAVSSMVEFLYRADYTTKDLESHAATVTLAEYYEMPELEKLGIERFFATCLREMSFEKSSIFRDEHGESLFLDVLGEMVDITEPSSYFHKVASLFWITQISAIDERCGAWEVGEFMEEHPAFTVSVAKRWRDVKIVAAYPTYGQQRRFDLELVVPNSRIIRAPGDSDML